MRGGLGGRPLRYSVRRAFTIVVVGVVIKEVIVATEYTALGKALEDAKTMNLGNLATRAFAAALWYEHKGDDEKANSYLEKAIAYEEEDAKAE